MIREDIETAVLSKLLNKKDLYYEHFSALNNNLFIEPNNVAIFSVMEGFYQQGKSIDMLSLDKELKEMGFKDSMFYIASLYSGDYFSYDFVNCINELVSDNKTTNLERVLEDLRKVVVKREGSVEEAIDIAVEELTKINDTNADDMPDIVKQLKGFVEEVELNSTKEGLTGITSGFDEIDMHTGGWKEQDLIIVGGASSMGKTSLALALAYNASRADVPSVIFSYEMSVNQLITRLVASDSYIENKTLASGELAEGDWHIMHKTVGALEKMPLYIDECSNTSLQYLLNRIRRYVLSKGVKLVMIDYLQLVSNNTRGRSREQEVSAIARGLKNIAKELNICVMALSQLSRGVEKRPGCRPSLGDLRESGEIEQAADTVMLVYRPEYYGFEVDENGGDVRGLAEIIFAKGRNVGIGNIFLFFNNKFTKFEQRKSLENYVKH